MNHNLRTINPINPEASERPLLVAWFPCVQNLKSIETKTPDKD
jgi:hypothetical protein